ncbi:protein-tyrosine phosphatase-like protein [Daldinia vernicosa]|uniref:protein-tyrosine phosphatase-like protein n=1 Tax=Daldinia vernicosa TaxID=114800 RepID=UPI002008AD2A|nr:protein-tyrosine phosphatase-like protein [Daldinia vernicosa]KAI0852238.1 protein-tyrosine phosphatase-like protein [Daldinia vernicosa]
MSIAFDNIDNFRDVGKTINNYLGQKVIREGVFFRSARPDRASPSDRRRIKDELGIRTVVDLRNNKEQRGRIPGLQYREIKVTGKRFEAFLWEQLGWWAFSKVTILALLGHRAQATSILSREAMQPRGLALRTFISPSSLPLLVHCALGKDRTGLIIALTLMILGVPSAAIMRDYQLSREGLAINEEARLKEARRVGLSPEWVDVPGDFVEGIKGHLDVKYGGIDAYLDGIGFGKDGRERLVKVLSV